MANRVEPSIKYGPANGSKKMDMVIGCPWMVTVISVIFLSATILWPLLASTLYYGIGFIGRFKTLANRGWKKLSMLPPSTNICTSRPLTLPVKCRVPTEEKPFMALRDKWWSLSSLVSSSVRGRCCYVDWSADSGSTSSNCNNMYLLGHRCWGINLSSEQ